VKTHGERAHEASDIAAIRQDIIRLINQMSLEELLQARVAITRIRLARLQAQLRRTRNPPRHRFRIHRGVVGPSSWLPAADDD
jgi:hypothetical protein